MSQWLAFHLTERCGLACVHCLRDPGRQPADLPLPVLEKVLDQAAPLHGIRHAGLTGGDPLLHPALDRVLDALVARGYTWHLVQSGRRFQRLLDLLDAAPPRRAALSAVNLSLDGAEEATHDQVRGAGSWREVMAAAAACQARGIPFSLQATLHALNAGEIERLGLLAAELGAAELGFSMTQATGGPQDAALYLPPEALDGLRDRVERLAGVLKLRVSAAQGFRRAERFHACEPFRGEVLHVDPHGRLSLCCLHAGVPGAGSDAVADLSEVSLAEAHARLLDLVHRLQRARLAHLAEGPTRGWEDFQCNACLAQLGKPHWVEGGSAGPPRRPGGA